MRYLMTFSYDGSKYNGYQKQPKKLTVQEVLEDKLKQLNSNKKVTIHSSGRTDKGVHAINQKAHFDLDKKIDTNRLKHSLNKMMELDGSIYIKQIEEVNSEFHARFDVKEKTYIYKINIGEYNPIEKDYVYQYNKELDIDKMKKASKYLIGKHDFSSFTKDSKEYETCIREIYSIDIVKNDDIVTLKFIGNGFLRYMVRNITGTLVDIGSSKIKESDIEKILSSKDRRKAGKTAPACGLYLYNVKY